MKRVDCIEAMYEELQDKLVVTIMGACAQELYDLGHMPNFFYLEHAMGLASSIGLGLAMNRPAEKVVVLDGDGSVLMNLGTLATLGAGCPHVASASTMYEFLDAAGEAFERDDFSVIVATVEAVGPDHFGMDMKLPENAFEFERHIRNLP